MLTLFLTTGTEIKIYLELVCPIMCPLNKKIIWYIVDNTTQDSALHCSMLGLALTSKQ